MYLLDTHAQAKENELTMITRDENIPLYTIKTIW